MQRRFISRFLSMALAGFVTAVSLIGGGTVTAHAADNQGEVEYYNFTKITSTTDLQQGDTVYFTPIDVAASAVLRELPDSTAVLTVTAKYDDLSSVGGGWTTYCGTYGGVTVDVPLDKQSEDFDGCTDGALWFDNAGQAHYCCSGGGTSDLYQTAGGVAYKAYRVSIRPVSSGESTPYVAHVHNYVYSIMDPATDNSDATYVYRCSCGDMKEWGIIPNTGFYTFNDNTAKDIRLANSGAVVKVDTGVWDTFHFMVINEFAKKGNVSLDITYKVSGEVHKFIIPAGADLTPALSSEGYANFRVLEAMFAQ